MNPTPSKICATKFSGWYMISAIVLSKKTPSTSIAAVKASKPPYKIFLAFVINTPYFSVGSAVPLICQTSVSNSSYNAVA